MKEIVLPSGRFATIRPVTWWDRICTFPMTVYNLDLRIMLLATRVVEIDGERLTLDEAKAMPLPDAQPLIVAIASDVIAGLESKPVA